MKNEELCFRDYMEVFCRIQHSYARRFLNPNWREIMIEDARKSGCSKKFITHMESFIYNYKGSSDEMYKALDNMEAKEK